jgi:hypothetical protein
MHISEIRRREAQQDGPEERATPEETADFEREVFGESDEDEER